MAVRDSKKVNIAHGGRVLIVMAKVPVPGRVKTRLTQGGVSEADAARTARASLLDTLDLARRALPTSALLLALDGSEDVLPPECAPVPRFAQHGNDLGERITHAFSIGFAAGYTQVCVLGSDTPHLPRAFVGEAWGRLTSGADVVFGPADDGGYYLAGLRAPRPELFAGIAWSGPSVLTDSLRNAEQSGLRTAKLPVWYDLDTVADLRRLRNDIKRGAAYAPSTFAVLSEIDV